MKVSSVFVIFLVFLNSYVKEAEGNCVLHVDKDLGSPSPVLVQNGDFLAPNDRGQVTVKRAGKVTAACPGTNRFIVLGNDTTDFNVLELRCKSGVTFAVGRWEGSFKDITCNGQPWTTSRKTGTCYGGINALHRVGYEVGDKFYSLYEACFNEDLVSTTYVRHRLLPSAGHSQPGRRPSFIEGGLFGQVQVSKLYNNKHQRDRLVTVLGEGMDEKYITKKQAIRRRAASLNRTLEITTGTLDVLSLPNKQGRDTPLYLADDVNNNGIVPVPMYFFKLVYDPIRKLATAFVSINSSFYNSTRSEQLTFCDDICAEKQLRWLSWRNDGARSFCCTYRQFADTVTFIPPIDVVGDLD